MISIMFQRPDRTDGIRRLSELISPHLVLLVRKGEIDGYGNQDVDYVCSFDRPDFVMNALCDYRHSKPQNVILARISRGYAFEQIIYVEVSKHRDASVDIGQDIQWLLTNGEKVADRAIDRVAKEYLRD